MTLPAQRADWASPYNRDQSKSGPAACSWEKGETRREEWMEGEQGEQFRRWSGDREQCGRAWSLNSCGLGRFSLLGESDPEEQGLCGHV